MHNRAQHQMLLCWCSLAVLIWSSKAFTLSNVDERLRAFVPLTIHPSPPQLLPTQLRHKHILLMYAPRKGAPMRLRVEFVQIGRYTDEIVATVSRVRTARLVLRSKTRGGPDKGVLHFPAPHRGIIPVQLDTHSNAAIVTALPPYAWLSIEASERQPLHVISRVGKLYFYVPRGVQTFQVFARGGGRDEHVRIRVYTPNGEMVGEASSGNGGTISVTVRVPKHHRAKVWWLTADKPPDSTGVFEDAYIWLSDVPTYVSTQRDGLIVPFCHGLVQPPRWRGEQPVELVLSCNAEPPAKSRLEARLISSRGATVTKKSSDASHPLELQIPPSIQAGEYQLRVRLMDARRKTIASDCSPVMITPHMIFIGGWQPLVRIELLWDDSRDAPPPLSIRRNVIGHAKQLRTRVELVRTEIPAPPGGLNGRIILRKDMSALGEQPRLIHPPKKLDDGHYQWKVTVSLQDGELIDIQYAHFIVKRGRLFREVPPPAAPPIPLLTPSERRNGFIVFVPDAVDAIPYNYRPQRDDINRELYITVAQDEYEPATFGIWCWEDIRGISVSASQLRHERGNATLPVDVRIARHWAQRVSWNTTTYRIIPELLERVRSFDLAMGQLRQVWLTVYAPKDAPPGRYQGTITVRDARGRICQKRLTVKVLPFALQRPKHIHWGLYSDSSRWNRYPDSQVRAELKDIVEHGITTLMCYPLSHSTVSYDGGELRIDSSAFVRYMRMAKEAGLRPPWVMSLQALAGVVKRLLPGKSLTDPQFKRLYQAIAGHFAQLARIHNWGECVWHAIDEPWSEEAIKQAIIELGYLKELGLTTFTTAGPVQPKLDAVLDVRCYSIGHLLSSPDTLKEQIRIVKASNDRLWYYGSGCYTGQDGNVISNRFITGFLFWRSGAEAEWSWTFLRVKGDAYDDFDGERHREAKDACIVYPSTTQGAPTPTLQWEGIREGIDDYCYAFTLQELARKRGGRDGRRALKKLKQLMKTVPIRTRPDGFTARDAQALRMRIAKLISKLIQSQ